MTLASWGTSSWPISLLRLCPAGPGEASVSLPGRQPAGLHPRASAPQPVLPAPAGEEGALTDQGQKTVSRPGGRWRECRAMRTSTVRTKDVPHSFLKRFLPFHVSISPASVSSFHQPPVPSRPLRASCLLLPSLLISSLFSCPVWPQLYLRLILQLHGRPSVSAVPSRIT